METSVDVPEEMKNKIAAEIQAKMRKKTVNLLKKQQAEFEAKLQAAEERAAKAEAENQNLESELGKLREELVNERSRCKDLEDRASEEKQGMQEQLSELKIWLEQSSKTKSERDSLIDELRDNEAILQKKIEELTQMNQQLEAQLLNAAGQVSDAFSRISFFQDEMEKVSKESRNLKHSHSNLLKDHDRLTAELGNARSALGLAEKEIKNKTKNIEELAEALRTSQEAQKSALDQLKNKYSEEKYVKQETSARDFSVVSSSLNKSNEEAKFLGGDQESNDLHLGKISAADGSILSDPHDMESLVRTIYELQFEKEYLKSQFSFIQSGAIEHLQFTSSDGNPDALIILRNQIADLNKKLEESKLLQRSLEDKNINKELLCSELQQRVHELSSDLSEGKINTENAIKERDERYAELDAKFSRLQKRAKQRIQEMQKEKEDLESKLSTANEKALQAYAEQSMVQQELEHTRRQAADAIRSLDGEKQMLQSTNSSQKELLEELKKTLEAREHTIEELNQNLIEKDKTVQDLQISSKSMEEKQQVSLSDLNSRHHKVVENLESQLSEVTLERNKAADEITKLQSELANQESKFTALEAASTGELARLGAALESTKGEVSRAKQEHAKDRENWESALHTYRMKLEELEKARSQYEIEMAKSRSQFESEKLGYEQLLKRTEDELAASRAEKNRVENDFKAYKGRAHVLLQKKDAELSAVKDTDIIAAKEAALKEARREVAIATAERDHAQKALEDAIKIHETELATRDVALIDSEQKIKDMIKKMESMKAQFQLEKEEWQNAISNIQETWRIKYETLEAQMQNAAESSEVKTLQTIYERLKEEHDSFREMANNMIEAKDKEISRLLSDNNNLQNALSAKKQVDVENHNLKENESQESQSMNIAVAEQQILNFARQQAQREEELGHCHRHIQALQDEVAELERENRLHRQQVMMLKDELRKLDRFKEYGDVDMTYLKNVIFQLLLKGEVEALLPVISTILRFSPDEIKKCEETNNVSRNLASTTSSASTETAAPAPSSFFSNFLFLNGN